MSRISVAILIFLLCSRIGFSQSIGQIAKLVASDRELRDELGRSVAISGDWAVAGSPREQHDESGNNPISAAGSVYIFYRDASGNWSQTQKIVASDRKTNGSFGASVAIDNSRLLVGSSGGGSGAAYILELNETSGTWSEVHKLIPSDGESRDQFGSSVSLDGGRIIVGAPFESHDADGNNSRDRAGSAYIYEYDALSDNWTEIQKIVASDRGSDDRFGHSVAISGDLVLCGAWGFDSSTGVLTDSGAAFAFKKDPTTGEWVEIQLITPNLEGTRAEFGYSLSMDGTTGLIGAYNERRDASGGNSLTGAGAAYIFNFDDVNELWSEDQKLTPTDREANDRFGISVDLSDGTAVVGATLQDYDADGNNFLNGAGSAYFFERSSGVWSEVNKLVTNDRAESDLVGTAVAIDGQKVILGVQNEDEDVTGMNTLDRAGSVYFFEPTNFAPIVVNPIDDLELLPGFNTHDIDFSVVFSDQEGDDLTGAATSNDPGVVTVAVSGSTLTITEVANGQTTITVTADDGNGGIAEDVFLVTVNSPTTLVNPVGFQLQQVGFGTLNIDLGTVFSDADLETLTYSASVDDETVATVSISTNTLIITEVAAGSATIDISAEDAFSSANDQFTLQINTPPSGTINNLLYQEGFTSLDITLTDFITDADGDDLQFSPSSNNTSVVTVSELNGVLTIDEVGFGTATVTIEVNDDNGGLVDISFDIRVNRAPAVTTPLSDLLLQQDFGTHEIDLSSAFTDDDGDDLTLGAQSSNDSEIMEEISGGATLVLTQVAMPLESPGGVTITVMVSDGFDGEVMDDFNITINNPPVYDQPIDDLTLQLGFETHEIDISSVFQDNTIDIDGLTVNASSADETIAAVVVSGNELIITEAGNGTTNITITANDNQGGTTDGSFELFINSPPTVESPFDNLQLLAGFATENLGLSGVFVDPDEDELSYTLTSDNESVVTVSASNGLLTITEAGTGSAVVTITATDGNGAQVSDEFQITVQEVPNTAPVIINELVDQVFDLGFQSSTIDITEVFIDADGDDLTITVVSSDESVITASYMEGMINITQVGVGDVIITVTANDGKGGRAEITFRVTVNSIVTGIDLEEKLRLSLYPNPAQDYLSIDLPKNEDHYSFRIFSLTGIEFSGTIRKEIFQGNVSIDVSNLPAGIYLLNLATDEETLTERFIKQ